MQKKFRMEDVPDGTTRIVVPHGELDSSDADALRAAVDAALAEGRQRVILDLTETTYAETAAVAAVLDGNARARRFGATLCVVVAPDSRVEALFALSRLDKVLQVVRSREDAL